MEIFQTMWTALTSENELLVILQGIPCNIIEVTMSMLLFTLILNIKSERKVKIRYVFTISLLSFLLGLFIPNPYKSFLSLLIIFIGIYYFFKTNILKTLLATIIPILCTVLCESIFTNIAIHLFNTNTILYINIPIYRLLISLGIQLIMFILYLLIKYSKVQISLLENMSVKSKNIFIINLFLATVSIIIQFVVTGSYIDRLPIYIVILSNVSLISYFLLSIYSLTKTTQLEITSLNLEQEKENIKILKDMQDDLHGFRHDFSNIMCTIGGYVQVKDMTGLSNYYSQIQKDVHKINNLGALNPEAINNPAIFVLISSKYSKALEIGIEMNINIFLDLNTLNMKIYEFTRILGILLDNAIEAAKDCNEKIINIEIRKDSKRNRQLLVIENTYINKNIDTEKIFEKKFSTKQGNSGLGLWEVRQILKKNNNLNLFTTKNIKFFKQQLEMYNI